MSRKYLMKGIAALALAFVAVSCNNDEDLFDPEASEAKAKYEAAFKAKFGEPAADHNWGFAPVTSDVKTRGCRYDANMWGGEYLVPGPLTAEQIKKVNDWFAANNQPEGVAIEYSYFFYQNVGATDYAENMNQFLCGSQEWAPDGEVMPNMNGGIQQLPLVWAGCLDEDVAKDFNDRKVYYNDSIGFMVESSTTSFGYHNSYTNEYKHDYVIIPGDVIDPSLGGRYFVGLDYSHYKLEADGVTVDEVKLDGYYNDWVVCITPGIKRASGDFNTNCRVIAEDLSVNEDGDFDFNDVVFDVEFNSEGARIVLLAAGGTLPLTVGDIEIHEAFGVDKDVMVNTGNGIVKGAVEFTIKGSFNYNVNNIPVKVQKDGEWIELEAVTGKAPGKIAVNTYYNWCNERQSIEQKYPEFTNYVTNQNVKWY